MKRTVYTTLYLMIVIVLSGCSSVKVLDSWKADNVGTLKDKNILVIARTDNKQARIAFENEIVSQLTSKGHKATASFTQMPNLYPDKQINDESQKKEIISMMRNEGFNAVVLTVIKDFQQQTKTETEGGYYAGATIYPRYYRGFYGYYYNPLSYSTFGTYVPPTSRTYTSKVYILETVAYNLDESEDKQMVAVVTSKIDNPSNVTSTAKEYVAAITKSLASK